MLITDVEILDFGTGRTANMDVRLDEQQNIAAVGSLAVLPGESVFDGQGGLLLPGLHDHHIHLAAVTAKQASIECGPPSVIDTESLARKLKLPGTGWLRGTGYHESVAGMLDRDMLDTLGGDRPIRIQHRGGRMWFLNSMALDILLAATKPPDGLERIDGRYTGRLLDSDTWLRTALGATFPDFREISQSLAAYGITGLTDMGPANGRVVAGHFARQFRDGQLLQSCVVAGSEELTGFDRPEGLAIGPLKVHLLEAELPDFSQTVEAIQRSHSAGRPVAFHCVTETELVFALAAIRDAGSFCGDRVEHASIAADVHLDEIAALELQVVAQPHFIAERGDQYLNDLDKDDVENLYRLKSFKSAGITLAAGSDAPFGGTDPWSAMHAAISRQTHGGTSIGPDESLSPLDALALYLADPLDLRTIRRIAAGETASLCLLDRPWDQAENRLLADDVRACWVKGQLVYDRVDQPPR